MNRATSRWIGATADTVAPSAGTASTYRMRAGAGDESPSPGRGRSRNQGTVSSRIIARVSAGYFVPKIRSPASPSPGTM